MVRIVAILVVLGTLITLLASMVVSTYNSLVKLRNRYENAFAQIDVQLRRRHDLIPNLVEAVKGYMKHERETLEAVIQSRNAAVTASSQAAGAPGDPRAMQALGSAEAALTGSLGRLFALAEAYPDLKADSNMSQLMEELRSTENKIAFARQAFNDGVTLYNTKREVFPSNIIAGLFNFPAAQLFQETDPDVKQAPTISF
ncbi:LemA family protein [Roseofilum casamattae]|uniref:LemA family protein n=1 Tax=Roseofilum casamattae BLCC-M143 TaxID=3022442 RepID=A0ABT7BYH5_9CYAN|nr:LemA family protein [Roseofilum casamattae]MDJ1184256.1 LemA family protein [Roseofilum casamattae BLCC-M143]